MNRPAPEPLDPARLANQRAALLRLADGLLGDVHLAEDALQEAWLTALAKRPADERASGWMARTVSHLAHRLRRGEQRRARHERHAATAEASEATDVVAALELHERLSAAVRGLPGHYREALYLRYYRDLGPTAIAARAGLPLPTIKSRLARGLEMLRQSLDARHGGDRRAWASALIGVGALRRPAGRELITLTAMTLTMTAKTWITAAAALAAAGAALWLLADTGPTPPPLASAPEAIPASTTLADDAAPRRAAAADRETPTTTDPAAAVATTVPSTTTLRGRVLDVRGKPANHEVRCWSMQVGIEPPAIAVQPGADGVFELPMPTGRVGFSVEDARVRTVLLGIHDPASPIPPVVVVAPKIELRGHVVTRDGAAVAGLALYADLDRAARRSVGIALDGSQPMTLTTQTDADGGFALAAAAVPGALLRVDGTDALLGTEVELPQHDHGSLSIVLDRRAAPSGLRGRVLGGNGAPLPNTVVVLGRASARTDDTGEFALSLDKTPPGTPLYAIARGRQPARVEDPSPHGDRHGWPPFLEIVVTGSPMTISGVARAPDGTPITGASVWIDDPTYAGLVDDSASFVEHLAHEQPWSDAVTTDDSGRFTLGGLLDRPYRVTGFAFEQGRALAPQTATAGTTNLVLELQPTPPSHRREGRVVDHHGRPVAGVQLAFAQVYRRVRYPAGNPATHTFAAAHTQSDADGRFALDEVADDVAFVDYGGDAVMPGRQPLDDADRSPLTLVVPRRCHVQVHATAPLANGTYAQLVDSSGSALALVLFSGRSSRSSSLQPLQDGRTEVLAVADTAAELRIWRDREIVHRQPVTLEPGEVRHLHVAP